MSAGAGVVGVTGLPCSGKSCAAELLASGEATGTPGVLVKADDLGHEVLTRPEVMERLREHFGDAIVAAGDAAATRRRLAARVFADAAELAWLEGVVHPLVEAETDRIIGAMAGSGPVVVESALILATSLERRCDRILLIEAEVAVRRERAAQRGWTEADLDRRDRRQLPLFSEERLAGLNNKIIRVRNDADDCRLGERLATAMGTARCR